ncbi:membrane protein [Oceanicola sp. 22II-s10i]|uniref:DMT family transporter n=1 Tax=Oceanicola sp. 22II-s10i TaxID=1317116 RepID=UPI000B526D98|nr:DMT family transporter [Oceanicola sp. 22II-s10i]OWU83725.1 membrane protein [Oceanicola sp. 22II-s10i]
MDNLRGILLVLFSMAAFSVEDLWVKQMTQSVPTGQVIGMIGLGGMLVFGLVALATRTPLLVPAMRRPPFVIRTVAEGFAALSFITSLSLVPLSTVAAVFQVAPLAITLGAALFLGEAVGWRRWSAIIIGFVGVLIIIRPGMEGFRPEALLVLIAVIAIAARDLSSRRLPQDLSSISVSFYGFSALVVAAPILMTIQMTAPTGLGGTDSLRLVGSVLFGVSGYYAIVLATRIGDVSAVMPFRYSRLVFSLIIGVAILGENPDGYTLLGAGIIIASGLYSYLRERHLARRAATQAQLSRSVVKVSG